jgi:hypothetical protein
MGLFGKRKTIFGQDKDYSGPLSQPVVKNVTEKFKQRYEDSDGNVGGFELNGGERMTKGAQEVWDQFKLWANDNNMDAEYNNNDDLETMKNRLTNRVKNKNRNK